MHQGLFQLDDRLSSLLDTLCLEVSYVRADSNSQALLEILSWRLTNAITQAQFSQLYSEWLSSKGVLTITKSIQVSTIRRKDLLGVQCPFAMEETELQEVMKLLKQEYNKTYLASNRGKGVVLEALDKVFQVLDKQEVYHLKGMQVILLYELLLCSKICQLKHHSHFGFWKSFLVFESQVNLVDSRLSLRAFKNYALESLSLEDVQSMVKSIDLVARHSGVYQQCIKTWGRVQKTLSSTNEPVAKRVFRDSQQMFLRQEIDVEQVFCQLSATYGASHLALHDIDITVVQYFAKIVQMALKKHITQFLGLVSSMDCQTPSMQTWSSKAQTLKAQHSISAKKSLCKRQSMKTPTKFRQEEFTPRKTKAATPRKSTNMRLVSPLSKSKPRGQGVQPRPHLVSPSSTPSNILQNLSIFKNQRVESFEAVMRRLCRK